MSIMGHKEPLADVALVSATGGEGRHSGALGERTAAVTSVAAEALGREGLKLDCGIAPK